MEAAALNATSFNIGCDYFLASLTGRSERTKVAYDKDLLQFKLYLVLFRGHLITSGDRALIPKLEEHLEKANGKLVDTRFSTRRHRQESQSRTILDQFDVALDEIRKEDIVGYFGYLESGKGLTRSTLLRRLASLRRFFSLLFKEGYPIAPEVVEKLDDMEIRRDRRLPIALDRDEALAFLDVIDNPRDRAMVLVMLFMGLRISEVVQLNVDDIGRHTDGITFVGKGGKERYVPVHPVVRDAIADYKLVRPEVMSDSEGEPLFVSQHRRRIDPSTVRRFIKRYAEKVEQMESRKRQKLSPHKLRHTFATLLLQGDVDIRHIQELLGHENLSTTEIYTSVHKRDLERAIDRHPLDMVTGRE